VDCRTGVSPGNFDWPVFFGYPNVRAMPVMQKNQTAESESVVDETPENLLLPRVWYLLNLHGGKCACA